MTVFVVLRVSRIVGVRAEDHRTGRSQDGSSCRHLCHGLVPRGCVEPGSLAVVEPEAAVVAQQEGAVAGGEAQAAGDTARLPPVSGSPERPFPWYAKVDGALAAGPSAAEQSAAEIGRAHV